MNLKVLLSSGSVFFVSYLRILIMCSILNNAKNAGYNIRIFHERFESGIFAVCVCFNWFPYWFNKKINIMYISA